MVVYVAKKWGMHELNYAFSKVVRIDHVTILLKKMVSSSQYSSVYGLMDPPTQDLFSNFRFNHN